MAAAIISGLNTTSHNIITSGSSLSRSHEIAEQLEVEAALSHQELVDQSDLIILGVKPQVFESVLARLHFHQPVLSVAAGITLERLGKLTNPNLPLIRIMPNLNAQILKGTTAICTNDSVSAELPVTAREITDSFGSTFDIPEKDFDTLTALAGSNPTYIYLFIETLAKAGVKYGIPEEKLLDIVTRTVPASAENLLQGSGSPHGLTDKALSPGGTTIAELFDLEKTRLTASVISSTDATIDRTKAL